MSARQKGSRGKTEKPFLQGLPPKIGGRKNRESPLNMATAFMSELPSFVRARKLRPPEHLHFSAHDLAKLVRNITRENRHREVDFGPPVGKEVGSKTPRRPKRKARARGGCGD